MLRNIVLTCLMAWAASAYAVVPPISYTGGVVGKQIMLGDFPSDLSSYSWYQYPLYHGTDASSDILTTIHFSALTSTVTPVHYAEFSININQYYSSPNAPGFRVYARKAVSPGAPSPESNLPSAYYNGGSGWTTAYATLNPKAGDSGKHRVDITDIMNELAAQPGGTGTSITLILEPTNTPNGVSPTWLGFGGASAALKIYPNLADRDYQRNPIAGGHTIFYWPFDAVDLAGSAVRSVVDGTDVSTPFVDLAPGAFAPVPGDYALNVTNGFTELQVGAPVRKLLGPLQYEPEDPNDAGDPYYHWPVNVGDHDYLVVVQYKQKLNGEGLNFLWDLLGSWGFKTGFTDGPGTPTSVFGTGYGNGVTEPLPAPFHDEVGSVKTLVLYYDNVGNKWYTGYHNGAVGWAWTTGYTESGYNAVQHVSGIWVPGNHIQGLAAFEFNSPRRLAEVKAAMERARALWASGVKALPPMLY